MRLGFQRDGSGPAAPRPFVTTLAQPDTPRPAPGAVPSSAGGCTPGSPRRRRAGPRPRAHRRCRDRDLAHRGRLGGGSPGRLRRRRGHVAQRPGRPAVPAHRPGSGRGPRRADRTWTRVAVAPDGTCKAAFDPLLRKALAPVGCLRLLRATYADATGAMSPRWACSSPGRRRRHDRPEQPLQEGRLDRRTDLMPRPYAAKGTAAERFGDAQRASWTISVRTDAPSSSTPSPDSPTAAWSPSRSPPRRPRRPGHHGPAQGASASIRPDSRPRRGRPPKDRHLGHGEAVMSVRGAGARFLTLLLAGSFVVLPSTAAYADGIRAQEWALEALHAQQAWQTTKGKGITAPSSTPASTPPIRLAGNVLTGKDLVGFGAERGDRSWARHGTAMAGIIAGHGMVPGTPTASSASPPRPGSFPSGSSSRTATPAAPRPATRAATPLPRAFGGPPTTARTSSTSPSATTPSPRTPRRPRTRRCSTP